VRRVWILQANPKLYDIDKALAERPVIYWRIPQHTDEVDAGDTALIWRAGAEAGFIGWGRFLTEAEHYDLSLDDDPFGKAAHQPQRLDKHAPIRVWPADHLPKAAVSALIPNHRIVTAPMGTVFRLDGEDLDTIEQLLAGAQYDLARPADAAFTPLPIVAEVAAAAHPPKDQPKEGAKITPAMFLLSSTPARPIEITIEGDALRLLLVERNALKNLDESWDSVGVYLLIGKPLSGDGTLSVYVGKAQGLRSRIKTGHLTKQWERCLLVQREGLHAFNASDISWLERRLIDVLIEAPAIDLVNKTPPPPESVPVYKAEILERTVVATLGALGVLGAFVA